MASKKTTGSSRTKKKKADGAKAGGAELGGAYGEAAQRGEDTEERAAAEPRA